MKKHLILSIMFIISFNFIYSNEVIIKDLILKDTDYKEQKLFLIDENNNHNYGYYLIKSKGSINSLKEDKFTIVDMLKMPFYEKVQISMILDYKIAYNKMIRDKKAYVAMIAVSCPLFFVTGAAGAGLIYCTYYLFTASTYGALIPFQMIGGAFTLILGGGFALAAVACLILFIVGVIMLPVSSSKNKKRFNKAKETIINQLNNPVNYNNESYYEENKKISIPFCIKF